MALIHSLRCRIWSTQWGCPSLSQPFEHLNFQSTATIGLRIRLLIGSDLSAHRFYRKSNWPLPQTDDPSLSLQWALKHPLRNLDFTQVAMLKSRRISDHPLLGMLWTSLSIRVSTTQSVPIGHPNRHSTCYHPGIAAVHFLWWVNILLLPTQPQHLN